MLSLSEYVSDSSNMARICKHRDAAIIRMHPYMQYLLVVANGFQQSNMMAAIFNACAATLVFLIVRYSPTNVIFNILTVYILIYVLKITGSLPYTRSLLSEPVRNVQQRDDALEYFFSFIAIVVDHVDALGIFSDFKSTLAVCLAVGVMSLFVSIQVPTFIICFAFAAFPFARPFLYDYSAIFRDAQAAIELVTKQAYEDYVSLGVSGMIDSLSVNIK